MRMVLTEATGDTELVLEFGHWCELIPTLRIAAVHTLTSHSLDFQYVIWYHIQLMTLFMGAHILIEPSHGCFGL